MTDSKNIKASWALEDKRQFCKQSCSKISQGLEKLDPRSGERAIWELFQNARDLAQENKDGEKEAHIRITVTPTEFIFAHQGKPFTHDSFASLVKQVSSQGKENEETVGQYGTGFLTTHTFGRIILIKGSLDMEDLVPGKYVNIDDFAIDRTFTNETEFVNKMARQLIQIEDLADAPKVDECRTWTEFHYQLNSADRASEKVDKAIDAALRVMPYVMTINASIVDVTIEDEKTGRNVVFKKQEMPDENDMKVMGIHLTENGVLSFRKIYYLQSDDMQDTVILPMVEAKKAQRLDGIAKLFVYFPLLGTEDFGMEFLFHSHRFFPVEERNALHLPQENENVKSKYEANVDVLHSMSDMVFDYLRVHASEIEGMVNILSLNFDCVRNKEDITNEFFENFKQEWIDFYETLPVFKVNDELRTLNSNEVELFNNSIVESFEGEQAAYFDSVYDAVVDNSYLPNKDVVLAWSKVVASWHDDTDDCFMTVDKLAEIMSEHPNMTLLHDFDTYLCEMSCSDLFDEYALIPNRNNELKEASELVDGKNIPGWLSDMVSPLVEESIEKLVRQDFADVNKLASFEREDLRDKITLKLQDLREDYLKKGKCYEQDTLLVLADICSIYKQKGSRATRSNVIPIICQHLDTEYTEKVLSPLSSKECDITLLPFKHLVENMLLEISLNNEEWIEENYSYILSLHSTLSGWTEYYDKNKNEGFAVTYGAFPNKNNAPCLVDDLKYGVDIPEELKDLYREVVGEDLHDMLVQEDFVPYYDFDMLSAAEVAQEIEKELEDNGFESDYVLDIINHLDKDDACWNTWFPHIAEKKAELFLKQVKPECQDGIFRLMKVNDSEKLNKLADLAEKVDMDEIIRRGEEALIEKHNEEADFEYKKSLGKYVEDSLQAILAERLSTMLNEQEGYKVEVINEQSGKDLVVSCNNKEVYYLEVKSRWGSDQSVMMSPLQMAMSVEMSEKYALCCVDMTHQKLNEYGCHEYPMFENTIDCISCLTNIGELNFKVSEVYGKEDEVHIGGNFKCIVPQKVIKDQGIDLQQLVTTIADRIVESLQ